jgi:hypothetical protein
LENQYLEVRADWNGTAWIVRDVDAMGGLGVRAEALVMRATRTGKDFAQGFIGAVHGLDWEVAGYLDNTGLRLLGVGAQFRGQTASPRGVSTRRVNLTQDGKVTSGEI